MNKRLEEMRTAMIAAATTYAAAYNKHESKATLKTLKSAAKLALDNYNIELAKETYKQWNAEGNPVKTAIRCRVVPHAQKCNFKVTDDDIMTVNFSENTAYDVDLPLLQSVIGAEKFANKNWLAMSEKLAWLIAARFNEKLGDNPAFKYEVTDAAKAFQFPDGVNPYTDDGIIVALQSIFDAILFIPDETGKRNRIHIERKELADGTVYSQATEVIYNSFTCKGNSRGHLAVCGTGRMHALIADAMHVILTNGDFGLDILE